MSSNETSYLEGLRNAQFTKDLNTKEIESTESVSDKVRIYFT